MSTIFSTNGDEFDRLTEIWESSVRATHDFLSEEDIQWLRPRIRNEWLDAVTLRVYKDMEDEIQGFIGVADGRIEMLFVDAAARGKGIGAQLLKRAIIELCATSLDVNEQNPQAIGFYLKHGFEITGRSPLDSMGKPFPLLHMRLA